MLNAGAWSRSSERVPVSLPTEVRARALCSPHSVALILPPQLDDFIPDCEEFYKQKHNGRKLYWHHMMSNGVVSIVTRYSTAILASHDV